MSINRYTTKVVLVYISWNYLYFGITFWKKLHSNFYFVSPNFLYIVH